MVSETSAMPTGLRPSVPLKMHVGHLAAAQGLGRLLAEHPADGVRDVRFAATVRADNRRDAGLKIQRGFVRKGLKTQNS
jgi:hypothetical protein